MQIFFSLSYQILVGYGLNLSSEITSVKFFRLSYRLTGNQRRMNGLSGGVSAVGDVKPRCQQASEILCTSLGISAFRRAGSGSGTLAIGAYATGRRRWQTLSRFMQSRFFPFADHAVLLNLHILQANGNDDDDKKL